ncbi:prostatic acid phosphatase [Folsomia candida]|uniref:acid phosphatase n=1 Tax=Folsomia candida TaxID=158441 RepID=A0A226E371_FOLCA|nr:prostatic acid phosphatase [Folsomia candida]OXA51474.1 Lysosomal acid phosphatase [Folsomia candida]
MRLGTFLIFVTIVVTAAALSVIPPRKDKADTDTLELVQIMWRHGDRTPIVQYPNDPLQNETLWFPYATGFEAITKKGKQMHYDFGQYLRKRYEGFLSPVYSQKEIYVQSSDADRAIMSAMSNMAGMWPPTPEDPRSEWNPQLQWQPIPIHTIPKKLDNFINFGAPCPRFKELKKEYTNDSPFAKSINEAPENSKLCQYIIKHAGVKECDFEVISDIWDTLRIQKAYNMTLPPWVASVYDQMESLSAIFFDSRVLVPTEEAKRVKAGPLLSFLVKNMELRQNETKGVAKMYALSGHDTTSSIALGALGVFDTQFPSYASAAIFEMHKIQNEHVVKVFFRNDTSVPPFEFEIPNCGYPCHLNKFKEILAHILVDGEKWNEVCKSGGSSPSASKSSASGAISTTVLPHFTSHFIMLITNLLLISKW